MKLITPSCHKVDRIWWSVLERPPSRWRIRHLGTAVRVSQSSSCFPPAEVPGSLRSLDISGIRWLESPFMIRGVESVESLSLEKIRGLCDLRSFGLIRSLKRLHIEDCPDLTSLDGPGIDPMHTEVFLVGKHKVSKR